MAVPDTGDLLVGLLRVAEATRTALEVDGAGLTLVQEDGPPRWVVATDATMELLEQVQHDFGEGPYLQAYSQDQAVAVADLGAAPIWARIEAVVGQLHGCGVLSLPVRLAGQPVGTLDAYSTLPRAWTAHELEAAGRFATVAGELVQTGVELAALAQAVVQDAQRERLAALATDDARVREAQAGALAAEQALQAAQADLAQRRAALDQAQVAAVECDRIAAGRNLAADERERLADERELAADDRDLIADERDRVADERGRTAGTRTD